ncbi:MAG: hypothetical protein HC932_04110 [Thermales bacterium]|nr:hypothetical protein [Thermales bacterium]
MSLKGFFTLLFKHLTSKWGRVLLSSMGIMISVWSILLTITLSTGLQDKLQVAVNSQAIVKTVQYYRENTGVSSLLDFRPNSKFERISYAEHQRTAEENPNVTSYAPSDIATLYINTNSQSTKCVDESINNLENTNNSTILNNCYLYNVINQPYDLIYETLKTNWFGSSTPPKANELVACYKCSDQNPLYESLLVNSPEEMLGKTISIEINTSTALAKAGEEAELLQTIPIQEQIPQSVIQEYKIISVIDDRDSTNPISTALVHIFLYQENFMWML